MLAFDRPDKRGVGQKHEQALLSGHTAIKHEKGRQDNNRKSLEEIAPRGGMIQFDLPTDNSEKRHDQKEEHEGSANQITGRNMRHTGKGGTESHRNLANRG